VCVCVCRPRDSYRPSRHRGEQTLGTCVVEERLCEVRG